MPESLKYMPFEPESMKLDDKLAPLNTVVRYPASVPPVETGTTVSMPTELFVWVPTPKISEPVTSLAPASATLGNEMMVPLLSVANRVTGFCTCEVVAIVVPAQSEDVLHA